MKQIILAFLLLIAYNAHAADVRYDKKSVDFLIFDGIINIDDAIKVETMYHKRPFKVLVIRSRGGSAIGGFMLADFVRKKGIGVYAQDYCDSACTFPFFNSKFRSINETGTVTLHNTSAVLDNKTKYTQADMVAIAQAAATVGANIAILYLSAGIPLDIVQQASTKFGAEGVTLNRRQLISLNLIIK